MEKIGCSNISIILTFIGVLPLIGGTFGIYEVLSNPEIKVTLGTLISLLILLCFGLIACGYRNCFFINSEHLQIDKSILFYKFKKKIYSFNQFNDIHVEIRHPVTTADTHETPFYAILFRGDTDIVDITDHMRFKKDVLNKKSWGRVKELLDKLSSITHLKISYSDKVKSYNSL